MEITEVRIKLVEKSSERLRAFCSVTFDGDFVVRDLKIIDGSNGPFVAMPSRKLADRCNRCGAKNHLRARFCNECGQRLNENRAPRDDHGRAKLHADVAHPINAGCRERIQLTVIEAYEQELERAKSPDYQPPSFDDFDDDLDFVEPAPEPASARSSGGGRDRKPKPDVEEPPEAEPVEADPGTSDDGSDYNSLIADLKREAAGRRGAPPRERERREPAPAARATGDEEFGAEILDEPPKSAPRDRGRDRDRKGDRRQPRPERAEPAPSGGRSEPRRDRPDTPRQPPPPPEPPKPAPPPPPTADDDDDEFGKGIL